MGIKAHLAKLGLAVSLLVLIVSFQNCSGSYRYGSGQDVADITQGNIQTDSGGSNQFVLEGNGDGYVGKASYLKYDTDFSCSQPSNNPAVEGEIQVDRGIYTMVKQNCQKISPVVLDPSLVRMDPNDSTSIIYNNEVYSAPLSNNDYFQKGQDINCDDLSRNNGIMVDLRIDRRSNQMQFDMDLEIRTFDNSRSGSGDMVSRFQDSAATYDTPSDDVIYFEAFDNNQKADFFFNSRTGTGTVQVMENGSPVTNVIDVRCQY